MTPFFIYGIIIGTIKVVTVQQEIGRKFPMRYIPKESLSELSLTKGTFFSQKERQDSLPTILIGSGRTGSQVINELKRKNQKEWEENSDFAYLVIDSDEINLKKKTERGAGGFLTQEEVVVYDEESLPWKLGEIFHKKYWELRMRTYGHPAIHIMLFADLSECADKDSITDVSYLIHHILESCGVDPAEYYFSAYLLIQDESQGSILPKEKKVHLADQYAVLKEIDYYMNLHSSSGQYNCKPGWGNYSSNRNIFHSCYFINSMEATGVTESPEAAIDRLTDWVGIVLSNPKAWTGWISSPVLNPLFQEPLTPARESWLYSVKHDPVKCDPAKFPSNVNFCYKNASIHTVRVPADKIQACYMNRVWKQVVRDLKEPLSQEEEELFCRKLSNFLKLSSFGQRYLDFIRKKGIQTDIVIADEEIPHRAEFRENPEILANLAQKKAHQQYAMLPSLSIDELTDWFMIVIERYITDVIQDYGICRGSMLLKKYMVAAINKLEQEIPKRKEYSEMQLKHMNADAQEYKEQIVRSILGAFNGRRSLADLTGQMIQCGNMDYFFFKHIPAVINEIRYRIVSRILPYCDIWAQIMDDTESLFEQNLKDINRPASSYRQQKELINFKENETARWKLEHYLEKLAQKQASWLEQMITGSFIKNIFSKNSGVGITGEKAVMDIIQDFQNALKVFLQNDLRRGLIEKSILAAYGPHEIGIKEMDSIWNQPAPEKEAWIADAVQEIVHMLEKHHGNLYSLEKGYQMEDFIHQKFIIVPDELREISSVVESLVRPRGITVVRSNVSQFMLIQEVMCIPLYSLRGISQMREAYEAVDEINECKAAYKQDTRMKF